MSNAHDDGEIRPITDAERDELLAAVAAEQDHWRRASSRFFSAWKEAVAFAGVAYFGDGTKTGFLAATSKDDLAPNFQRVQDALGVLSGGERRFLIALYSFYNQRTAHELWQEASESPDNLGAIISGLDLARRRVLAELAVNYSGW